MWQQNSNDLRVLEFCTQVTLRNVNHTFAHCVSLHSWSIPNARHKILLTCNLHHTTSPVHICLLSEKLAFYFTRSAVRTLTANHVKMKTCFVFYERGNGSRLLNPPGKQAALFRPRKKSNKDIKNKQRSHWLNSMQVSLFTCPLLHLFEQVSLCVWIGVHVR